MDLKIGSVSLGLMSCAVVCEMIDFARKHSSMDKM